MAEKNHRGWPNRNEAAASARDNTNSFFEAVTEICDMDTKANLYARMCPPPTDADLEAKYLRMLKDAQGEDVDTSGIEKKLVGARERIQKAAEEEARRQEKKAVAADTIANT